MSPKLAGDKVPSVPLLDIPSEIMDRLLDLGAAPEIAGASVYRAMAAQPDVLRGWIELSWGLRMRSGPILRLRELVIVRIAVLAEAQFVRDQHEALARELGVTDVEIDALADWRGGSEFSPSERAALALADAIHEGKIPDDVLEELAQYFEPPDRVELMVTCAFYEAVPRVLNALRVD